MYKLETETARKLLDGSRNSAQVVLDSIQSDRMYLERLSTKTPDILLLDPESGESTVLSFDQPDPEPTRKRIERNEERLAVLEESIQSLLESNPELQE